MENHEEIFSRTDAEYRKMDKLLALSRELFETLKAMEEIGLYGSAKWAETFGKYRKVFKEYHGYFPHWAR